MATTEEVRANVVQRLIETGTPADMVVKVAGPISEWIIEGYPKGQRETLAYKKTWNAAISAAIKAINYADDGGRECGAGIYAARREVDRLIIA